MNDKPKTLAAKLCDIMASVENVPKRGHNSGQNYDYVRAADISDYIRKELVKERVICLPEVISHEVTPYTSSKGNSGFLSTVEMKYWFINAEDPKDTLATMVVGSGADPSDKCFPKALTIAQKYAMMQTFCIGGDDGDNPEYDGAVKSNPSQKTPIATQGSVSPNTVGRVLTQTADSLPKMPGTFYYKVPWEEKDEWSPVLKRARARWNPGNKHWESQTKVVGMDRFWTNKPKGAGSSQEAFSMEDNPPMDQYDYTADADTEPNI